MSYNVTLGCYHSPYATHTFCSHRVLMWWNSIIKLLFKFCFQCKVFLFNGIDCSEYSCCESWLVVLCNWFFCVINCIENQFSMYRRHLLIVCGETDHWKYWIFDFELQGFVAIWTILFWYETLHSCSISYHAFQLQTLLILLHLDLQ